nr:FeoA family protein [Myroides oncorhynchi]
MQYKLNLNKVSTTLDLLKRNEKGVIVDFDMQKVPLKLLEMGCLPGNAVELLEVAPLGDPIYLCINDTHLSIRKELAREIQVDLVG